MRALDDAMVDRRSRKRCIFSTVIITPEASDSHTVYRIYVELPAPNPQFTAVLQSFFPTFIVKMHKKDTLNGIMLENIHTWRDETITVNVTCGGNMPTIPIKVFRFISSSPGLNFHIQHFSSGSSRKPSVLVGMQRIDKETLQVCTEYIEQIENGYLASFAKLCWQGEENKFQEEIFELIMKCGENKLLRLVRRLVVATFIMSHTLTIRDTSGSSTEVSEMVPNGKFPSSRLLNRQLKYAFHYIQKDLAETTLSILQDTLLHPGHCNDWFVAFFAVVGLCLVSEDQQKTLHIVMETNIQNEKINRREPSVTADSKNRDEKMREMYEAKANKVCKAIDADMKLVMLAFCRWSHHSLPPDAYDEGFENTITQFIQLVEANSDFLAKRKDITIAPTNWPHYTSRLVARFVSMIWDEVKERRTKISTTAVQG